MDININDIKNGMTIIIDGNLCSIVEFQHVKPGKGPAFVRIKLKNLRTGSIVENTYKNVGKIELHRLFDRFYRGDKARTYTGSFVGLSIAKAIAKNHRGDITACQTDDSHISFKVILK